MTYSAPYDPLAQSSIDERNAVPQNGNAMYHKLTKQFLSKIIYLSELRPILAGVKAELADATCWRRTLYHELEVAADEVKRLTELDRALIIREAELQGKIKKVSRAASTDKKVVIETKMKALFEELSSTEQASLVADLLKDFTSKLGD